MDWTLEQIRNQFLIITQPRSGTQMLERALSAHDDVVMRTWSTSQNNPHPFMELYGFRALDCQEIHRPFRGTITHQWGEAFTREVFGVRLPQYWTIVGYFFPRVIILNRENQLKRYLSYCISDLLNHWGVQDARPDDPVIDLDFDKFTEELRDRFIYQDKVMRAFPQAMTITYEELVEDWDGTFGRILDFLGIRRLPIKPNTFRQEHRPVKDIIGNWGPELERKFAYYGWAGWLQ